MTTKQPPDNSTRTITAAWKAPLPPPEMLAQYNQAMPNGAERVMKMIEDEQQHRIDYENTLLQVMAKDTKRGQWLGFGIAVLAMVAAGLSVWLNADYKVSIALVSLPVLGIIKSIVQSRSE